MKLSRRSLSLILTLLILCDLAHTSHVYLGRRLILCPERPAQGLCVEGSREPQVVCSASCPGVTCGPHQELNNLTLSPARCERMQRTGDRHGVGTPQALALARSLKLISGEGHRVAARRRGSIARSCPMVSLSEHRRSRHPGGHSSTQGSKRVATSAHRKPRRNNRRAMKVRVRLSQYSARLRWAR